MEESDEIAKLADEILNPGGTSDPKTCKKKRKRRKKKKAKEEEVDHEAELEWCLGQLWLGLSNPECTKEQEKESLGVIAVLSSDKSPLVKIKAKMRAVFGDYRKLMKDMPLTGEHREIIERVKEKRNKT